MEQRQEKIRPTLRRPKSTRGFYATGASLLIAASLAVPLVPAYAQQIGQMGQQLGQLGQSNQRPGQMGQLGRVAVSQIANATSGAASGLAGQRVTVEGVVAQVFDPVLGHWALLLDDPDTTATERVLVVVELPLADPQLAQFLDRGDRVHVQGTLRRIDQQLMATIQRLAGVSIGGTGLQQLAGTWFVDATQVNLLGSIGHQVGRGGDTPDLPAEVQRATPGGPVRGLPNISPDYPDRSAGITGAGIRARDILSNPGAFLNRSVILNGQVSSRFGERAFVLDNNMLVLLPVPLSRLPNNVTEPSAADVTVNMGRGAQSGQQNRPTQPGSARVVEGETIEVAGVVRRFDPSTLSRELNMDLGAQAFSRFANGPVLVAQAVDLNPLPPGRQPGLERQGAQQVFRTSVSLIASASQNFQGDMVNVSGRVLQAIGPVLGRWAFTLDDPGTRGRERVLVIADTSAAQRAEDDIMLTRGDSVRVIGMVHVFDRATAQDLQRLLGIRLNENEIRQFLGGAVIVANVLDTTPNEFQAPGSLPPRAGATATTPQQVLNAPQRFTQGRVTVEGQVTSILGRRAVVLDNGLLIFSDVPLSQFLDTGPGEGRPAPLDSRAFTPLMEGDHIQVTGSVVPVSGQLIEGRLGIDVRNTVFGEFQGRPAIIVSSVRPGSRSNVGSNLGANQQNMSGASQNAGGAAFTAPLSAIPR